MRQETIEKFEKVQELVAGGMPIDTARKKHSMGSATYYKVKKLAGKKKPKPKKPGPKPKYEKHFAADTAAYAQTEMTLIRGTPAQIREVLGNG